MKPKTYFFFQPTFLQLPNNSRHNSTITTTAKFLLLLALSSVVFFSFFYDAIIVRLGWLCIMSIVIVGELKNVCDQSSSHKPIFLSLRILLCWWSIKSILSIPSLLVGLFLVIAIFIGFQWFKFGSTSTSGSDSATSEKPFETHPLKILIPMSILADLLSCGPFFGSP